MEKILYANKKDEIREVLLQRARAGLTIYYSELGELLKISPLGKPILDEISREERGRGRPDLTYLVVSKRSGLPGQIEFEPAKPPTPAQREKVREVQKKVFKYHQAKGS